MKTELLADFPKAAKLANGDSVTLRPLSSRDGEAMWLFFERIPLEDRAFFKEDVLTREEVAQWLAALDSRRETVIVAATSSSIVGIAALQRQLHGWAQHVGELRIVVDPEVRRTGLGYRLAQEIFTLAVEVGLQKMISEMVADQQSPVIVFERLGFKAEALLRDHVKDRHGNKHDLLIMAHSVEDFLSRAQTLGVAEGI